MDKQKNQIVQFIFWTICFLLINRVIGLREEEMRALHLSLIIVSILVSITYINVLVLVPKLFLKRKYFLYSLLVLLLVFLPPYLLFKWHIFPSQIPRPHRLQRLLLPLPPPTVLLVLINSSFLFISTIIRLALNTAQKEKQSIQMEKERLLIETRYLRSQMNPHFFLNALNNLQYINRFLPQEADKYINTLAEMMRYVTYDCRENQVPLAREITYIRHYIYFQQVKDEEIKVEFQVKVRDEQRLIEPMLLMPFVENAFKYALPEGDDGSIIKISIEQDEQGLCFTCENSINQKATAIQTPVIVA